MCKAVSKQINVLSVCWNGLSGDRICFYVSLCAVEKCYGDGCCSCDGGHDCDDCDYDRGYDCGYGVDGFVLDSLLVV